MPRPARNERRRALVLVLVAVIGAGLYLTRAHWLPLVATSSPYSSTPAENFAVGSAGIVLPPITPIPGMTGEQVNAALVQVKHALEASHLDPRMLNGRDPSPLLDLLAPDSANVIAIRLNTGDYGTTLIRLAPGAVLADTPRVDGTMSYSRVDWRGTPALQVVTNYVWAYAFRQPQGVVVVHSETDWMFPLSNDIKPTSQGMYLGRTTGYWHGMDCAAAARGFTSPPAPGNKSAHAADSDEEPLDAYFDPTRSVRVDSACQGS